MSMDTDWFPGDNGPTTADLEKDETYSADMADTLLYEAVVLNRDDMANFQWRTSGLTAQISFTLDIQGTALAMDPDDGMMKNIPLTAKQFPISFSVPLPIAPNIVGGTIIPSPCKLFGWETGAFSQPITPYRGYADGRADIDNPELDEIDVSYNIAFGKDTSAPDLYAVVYGNNGANVFTVPIEVNITAAIGGGSTGSPTYSYNVGDGFDFLCPIAAGDPYTLGTVRIDPGTALTFTSGAVMDVTDPNPVINTTPGEGGANITDVDVRFVVTGAEAAV